MVDLRQQKGWSQIPTLAMQLHMLAPAFLQLLNAHPYMSQPVIGQDFRTQRDFRTQ
jgi:hypothetical protein